MCKSVMCAMRCIIISMIIGIAFGAMCCCKVKSNNKIKKKANKAIGAVEDFIEDVPQIFKQKN